MFSYHFSTKSSVTPKHLRYGIWCRWKTGNEQLMPTDYKTENEACAGAFGLLVTLGNLLDYVGVVCPLPENYLKSISKAADPLVLNELTDAESQVIMDTDTSTVS